MRRTYDRDRYLDRVALIREHVPDVALTTDIIVGFPGETEADFEQTLTLVEQVGYDGARSRSSSRRGGVPRRRRLTDAARSPTEEKVARLERLVEVVQRRARERAQRFVGAPGRGSRRKGASRTTPTACAAAPATTRSSTSAASPRPASWRSSRVHARATSQTLAGEERIATRLLVEA